MRGPVVTILGGLHSAACGSATVVPLRLRSVCPASTDENFRCHVGLSSASGEIHALSSKNKADIERVVLSINEAIVKHQ